MGVSVGIDAFRSQPRNVTEEDASFPPVREICDRGDLRDRYDILFVTNPTDLHYETLRDMLPKTAHAYIEKPVFESTGRDYRELPWRTRSVYHVACPIRRHPGIQYLKHLQKRPISVRVLCSSYLPDWRPGVDYTKNYSASADHGGGVWLDLIHEWDYVRYLWGDPLEVSSLKKKVSGLNIGAHDISVYLADFGSFILEMHLDYFGRVPRRSVELFFDDDILNIDILNGNARRLLSGELLPFPKTDIHREDLRFFLDAVLQGKPSDNPPDFAWNTLKIAEKDVIAR